MPRRHPSWCGHSCPCTVGRSPRGCRPSHNTRRTLWRCCTGSGRSESTGRHSRFRSLPNRCKWWWSCRLVCLVCGQYRAPRGKIRGKVDSPPTVSETGTVTGPAAFPLIPATVVVVSGKVVVKIAAFHVGGIILRCFGATTDGSEGETVEVGLVVCHVAIVGPIRRRWRRSWPSSRIVHKRALQGSERDKPTGGTDHGGGPGRLTQCSSPTRW